MSETPVGRRPGWRMTWSIKASKLCNLRCRYCYEWADLADPRRIPLSGWRRILVAIRRYHRLLTERRGRPGRSLLALHGGEPSLLPVAYLRQVVSLARAVLDAETSTGGEYRWAIQTNLYSLPRRLEELLVGERFHVSVSFDGVPGARVHRRGGVTEERVAANLSRLLDRGLRPTGAVVLAGHTRHHLRGLYGFFAARGMPFKVIPMLAVPQLSARDPLALDEREAVAALTDLFEHWIDDGCRVEVEPLRRCLTTALLSMAGRSRPVRRRRAAERALVVDTDGSLYPRAAARGVDDRLGNLFEQSLDEILAGARHAASLAADDERVRVHCAPCRFAEACDSRPVLAAPRTPLEGPCAIESRLCRAIVELVEAEGLDASELRGLARSAA